MTWPILINFKGKCPIVPKSNWIQLVWKKDSIKFTCCLCFWLSLYHRGFYTKRLIEDKGSSSHNARVQQDVIQTQYLYIILGKYTDMYDARIYAWNKDDTGIYSQNKKIIYRIQTDRLSLPTQLSYALIGCKYRTSWGAVATPFILYDIHQTCKIFRNAQEGIGECFYRRAEPFPHTDQTQILHQIGSIVGKRQKSSLAA